MAYNAITQEELNQFRSLPVKKKVDSMEAYLIGYGGRRYNMQEVGALVFGSENYSFTVSLIHRCYNFSGQNGGKYRNGCRFEQAYGYRVTRKDIEAFVRQYPNGTFSNGITFEDFLVTRAQQNWGAPPPAQRQSAPRQRVQRPDPPQMDYQDYGYNEQPPANMKLPLLLIGGVSVLVLLYLLKTGGLFRHWIISLIALLLTIGAIGSWKEL